MPDGCASEMTGASSVPAAGRVGWAVGAGTGAEERAGSSRARAVERRAHHLLGAHVAPEEQALALARERVDGEGGRLDEPLLHHVQQLVRPAGAAVDGAAADAHLAAARLVAVRPAAACARDARGERTRVGWRVRLEGEVGECGRRTAVLDQEEVRVLEVDDQVLRAVEVLHQDRDVARALASRWTQRTPARSPAWDRPHLGLSLLGPEELASAGANADRPLEPGFGLLLHILAAFAGSRVAVGRKLGARGCRARLPDGGVVDEVD